MKMEYLLQPPKRYTFEQPKLKEWVEKYCNGKVLNLFAGRVELNVDEYRVDLDTTMPADYYGDAFEFVNTTDMKFDTIVFDPPYSLRKAREKYEGRYIGKDTKIKDILHKVLIPNGRVISLGYSSTGMSKKRGFNKIALCVVCHNGNHDDTIGVVEDKDLIVLVEELNQKESLK
jgi:hypothetical protein